MRFFWVLEIAHRGYWMVIDFGLLIWFFLGVWGYRKGWRKSLNKGNSRFADFICILVLSFQDLAVELRNPLQFEFREMVLWSLLYDSRNLAIEWCQFSLWFDSLVYFLWWWWVWKKQHKFRKTAERFDRGTYTAGAQGSAIRAVKSAKGRWKVLYGGLKLFPVKFWPANVFQKFEIFGR